MTNEKLADIAQRNLTAFNIVNNSQVADSLYDIPDLIAALRAEQDAHNALRERLKDVEWVCVGRSTEHIYECPACKTPYQYGTSHTDDCWLAKAIKTE